jgi:hypothetical protein
MSHPPGAVVDGCLVAAPHLMKNGAMRIGSFASPNVVHSSFSPRTGLRGRRRETGGLQVGHRLVHVGHADRPADDAQAIQLEHSLISRRERRAGLRRDDLEVLPAAERDEGVLGAAPGVFAADAGLDARQSLELRDPFVQAADSNDQMIELCHVLCIQRLVQVLDEILRILEAD